MSELHYLEITELARAIREREISPVEVTAQTLSRIEALDPMLDAFVTVLAEDALDDARMAEEEISAGRWLGPLHGVPIGIKDLCAMRGVKTTCASRILADQVTDFDATVVSRLKAAGAVAIGKLNLTEFAGAGYHPDLRAPKNPWHTEHWPGLSSSGSGAATAAGLCFGSLGTDTGGSIRLPSAACGITGIKPTYGRVSRHGVAPLCDTLDHVGPMTRSVADAAAMLAVLAGPDAHDPTSLRAPVPDYVAALDEGVAGLRIGYDREYASAGVEQSVQDALRAALETLAGLGAVITPITMPAIGDLVMPFVTIFGADAVASHREHWPARAADYGPCFHGYLESGSALTGADYADAHRARLGLRGRLAAIFEEIDVIACPSLAFAPPRVEDTLDQNGIVADTWQFTIPFDLSGSPTLSLPCGFSDEGLPLSLQLVGRDLDEATLCRTGHAYQTATDWHRRRPPLA